MNAKQLLQHFERISEVPDAIPRLRRFILELAVRGKLVEQDPSEEPSEEQLERIIQAKVLLGRKKRGAGKKLMEVASEVRDYPLSAGWVTSPLSDLVTILNGRAYKQSELLDAGTPVLRVGNLFTSNKWYYSSLELEEDKYCDDGDLIFAWSASFGPFIWNGGHVIYHYHIWKLPLHSPSDLSRDYLYLYLLNKTAEIKAAGHGISMVHMTKEKMERLEVPLPPLAEQHRIVAKVDELMNLCDQLEAAKAEREQCRDSLVAASLQGLNQPAEEEETFREHARFTFNNLPRITTSAAHIKQLRQTILNLAVRGKLVEQDSSDEPASFLLDQILAQPWAKKRKSKAILPKKDFSSIAFPLPAGWSWAVVETLLPPDETVTYGILKPEWVAEGIPTVRVTEMKTGKINLAALKQCDPVRAAKFQKTTLKPGDLLISKDGTIGKTAFVPPELAGSNITQHLIRYPLSELVNRFFVKLAIDSPFCQKWMAGETKGVALKGVNVSDFRQMPLPIPPLAEQYRIVAKVDELMSLCVQLEAQITVTEQESRRFLESVLADALSHGSNLSTEAQVA